MQERYYSYSRYLKETFGEKIYKICLNGNFSCPNRDGTISTGGCSFCSIGGSGEYAESCHLSLSDQIASGKKQTAGKYQGAHYIAYLQAYTNTYAPVKKLRAMYQEILAHDEILALSIGTRPDCLADDVLDLLAELNQIKPIHLELGFQTCHDETARQMNRGYASSVLDDAVYRCFKRGLRVTLHLILGYPGEEEAMQYETIHYINRLPIQGVKMSMLYVLKDTALGRQYSNEPFPLYDLKEYTRILLGCIERLRPDIVIERITGDGPRQLLLAPEWITHKRYVLNYIQKEMKQQDSFQGKQYRGAIGWQKNL